MDKKILTILRPFFLSKPISHLSFNILWFESLFPSQQIFSHVATISSLPWLNQYLAEDKVFCSRTQQSDYPCGES